jgi:hypothetical protein
MFPDASLRSRNSDLESLDGLASSFVLTKNDCLVVLIRLLLVAAAT